MASSTKGSLLLSMFYQYIGIADCIFCVLVELFLPMRNQGFRLAGPLRFLLDGFFAVSAARVLIQ